MAPPQVLPIAAWLTLNVLKTGVIRKVVGRTYPNGTLLYDTGRGYSVYAQPGEWFTSRAEAVVEAKRQRDARAVKARAEIATIEAYTFEE
jgi:hypothetical protein